MPSFHYYPSFKNMFKFLCLLFCQNGIKALKKSRKDCLLVVMTLTEPTESRRDDLINNPNSISFYPLEWALAKTFHFG